jgi:predicted dehydrogenase
MASSISNQTLAISNSLRWGILGTGGIARKFAAALKDSRTGRLVAVGSRAEDTLRAFLADFPVRGYANYDAVLADPEVEAVYISPPHPFHAEWAIRAARAGKHILCEKPLTMNAAEAAAVIDAARSAGVFLMEAFMYRCHPQTARLVELVREGRIGPVRLIHANFSFRCEWNPRSRLLARELGGGGILDVGCYCASMARLIAGAAQGALFADPIELKAVGNIGEAGVDEFSVAVLKFPAGIQAQIACGVRVALENTVRIYGDNGRIDVPSPYGINGGKTGSSSIFVTLGNQPPEEVKIHADRTLFAIEADTVAEYISARESPAMSWADSLGNMRTLDRWRAEIGLAYDADSAPGA